MPKLEQKAQGEFLRQQRAAVPKVIVGDASTSVGIPAGGLVLKPTKRTKEEEERLAKTPSATIGSPGAQPGASTRPSVTSGMGGRHYRAR